MAKQHGKRHSRKDDQIKQLTSHLLANGHAITEGPKRKKWTLHDLKVVKPLTVLQESMYSSFLQGSNVCAVGSAGTGKSFIGLYLALNEVLNGQTPQTRIIIVRSIVPTREIGFLPGTLEEKISTYEAPYRDMMYELFGRADTYDHMKEAGLITFIPTSFVRGLTWDNAVVMIDEAQNMSFHELNSVMTRLGDHSRVILTGDYTQTDLRKRNGEVSGINDFLKVVGHMRKFDVVAFTKHDIVRSDLVRDWIIATEEAQVSV